MKRRDKLSYGDIFVGFFQSWFQLWIPSLLFFSLPQVSHLLIRSPRETCCLFIHLARNYSLPLETSLSLSPRISAKPRRNSIPSMQMRALRSQDIPLLPLARNHDKTRISIFRVIAPLAFHCNRRFPFNRSPFDNGEIFPRERERELREEHARGRSRLLSRTPRGPIIVYEREFIEGGGG